MTFLKNKRAWKRWAKANENFSAPFDEPTEYPCFGYTTVLSYGYEEDQAKYLYADDVAQMAKTFNVHAA